MLYKQNLIQGGNVKNAIVIVDRMIDSSELDHLKEIFNQPKVEVRKEGILNNVELRFKNEPARHKLLDLVGDLALAGRPIKGQILAARPGHAANVAFAKKLKKHMKEAKNSIPEYDPKLPALMDIQGILNILPHRYPFALIDKIYHLDDKTVAGIKNVTVNEPFFTGHFPGEPVMPGVLQIEAMAQTGGILVLRTLPNPDDYRAYIISIDKCRFKRVVVPGDTIIFKCELKYPIRRGIATMHGQAFVAGELVCEAQLSASIVKKNEK
jgi:UDP-3-O-[3-hydroxymyristoyl] N-acetylglucosamine deacetylase/3-hydroxyacyl-[acyl-carrier-protein] dehydratase